MLRVVAPMAIEWARFHPNEYQTFIEEHAEPWTYMKFCHLQEPGLARIHEGPESGNLLRGAAGPPQRRRGYGDPLAEEAYLEFFGTLGGKPVHYPWRIIGRE